jgi:hypothetical protein
MMNEQTTSETKQGFLTYLGSFFTGWATKDLIENEIRARANFPKLAPMTLKDAFSLENLKLAKKELGGSAIWKDLGKEAAIEAGSIVPGALVGYVLLKPVVRHFASAQPDPVIRESMNEGKMQAEPLAALQK